jgi:peptide chain release factor 2
MYLNWAKLKGFESKILNESLHSPKHTKEITLLIEGVAIFGMLKGEAGMHEMVYGRTPGKAKKSVFVKVRVLPVVDKDDSEVPSSEISIEKRNTKGTGLRCKRYKSTIKITHRPTADSITATNDLTPDEAAPLIEDLLHSELAHRQSLESSALEPGEESAMVEDIIRKYTFNPRPAVRDARTGVTTHNLGELWKGALDEFLYAILRERSGNHPADN